MDWPEGSKIPMLRHAVATLAYRAAKTLRAAPAGFEIVRAAPTTRTAAQILAHMGDLMEWAVRRVDGEADWRQTRPGAWDQEVSRFFLVSFSPRGESRELLS
jgi:hypothetical protein